MQQQQRSSVNLSIRHRLAVFNHRLADLSRLGRSSRSRGRSRDVRPPPGLPASRAPFVFTEGFGSASGAPAEHMTLQLLQQQSEQQAIINQLLQQVVVQSADSLKFSPLPKELRTRCVKDERKLESYAQKLSDQSDLGS